MATIGVLNLADIYDKAQRSRANEQAMAMQDMQMQAAAAKAKQQMSLKDLVASSYTPASESGRARMDYGRLEQGLAKMGDFDSLMKLREQRAGADISKAHQEKIKAAQSFVDAGDAMGLQQFVLADDETPDDVKVSVNKDGSMTLTSASWPEPRMFKPSARKNGADPYSSVIYTKDGAFAFNNRTEGLRPLMHNGKQIVGATSDPSLQGNISRAKEEGKVEGASGAEAKIELPKNLQEAENTIKLVDDLLAHPGLKTAVGKSSLLGIQHVPGTDAKAFMTRLDQLRGKQFLQAYETLKGGGQITEVEGQKATQAIARMDNASTEQEFITASREFQDIIRQGVERAKKRAGVVAPGPTNVPEGTTRTNKRTGEVQVFRGGQWLRQ